MSEYINDREKRLESLFQFSRGMIKGEDGKKLIEKYGEALKHITPHDIIIMEERQLANGIKVHEIKSRIENVMNVIYDHLKKYEWERPDEGHALYYLMQENRALENLLNDMKKDLQKRDLPAFRIKAHKIIEIDKHYIRKENILFPYLEKIWENSGLLAVMWSIHDDIRAKLKELYTQLASKEEFDHELFVIIGDLFFLLYGMIFKEELVIYPVAYETIDAAAWQSMFDQSFEIGFSFISPPARDGGTTIMQQEVAHKISDAIFKCETGSLNQEQLQAILNVLPFDLSFINENDEVRYFSNPKDRFFPRSPAIIGRKVQKCHPPESVHMVEKILAAFKAGTRDEASFWIQMRGKFILIRYYAVRKENGEYLGTLEVGQDITDIKKLEGEGRLLDWE